MPDVARASRWTKAQAVAWIAFRTFDAVRRAAIYEAGEPLKDGRPGNPFMRLHAAASLGDIRDARSAEKLKPPERLLRAMDDFETARLNGQALIEDRPGLYRSAAIKELFPSLEGRGAGPARGYGVRNPKVQTFGLHILTSQRHGGFWWCKTRNLVKTKRQYTELRRLALEWAEIELAARKRWDTSVKDAEQPLSLEEETWCRSNLSSWRSPGRPRAQRE
jgi:hypothetical protein